MQAQYRAPPAGDRRWWWLMALLLVAGLALRALQFGNERIHVDENFYLLVGDRMLHGALPYVDIWDRKPIGLFLIFAGVRLLGGAGFVQYQLVAAAFAIGTAMIAARIAWRMATPLAATIAGFVYLLLLGTANGAGGQAPVFYNLLVAGAAWATLEAWLPERPDPRAVRRLGAIAMLLTGLAMQIKYTALFEGLCFGLVLMWRSWQARRAIPRLIADAALWVALALLPTAAALGYYVAIGQAQAFLYANFFSIGGRSGATSTELLRRLAKTWNALHIPVFAVVLSIVMEGWRRFPQGGRNFGFTVLWLGAAIAGYLVFGTYFDHYALPLMLPLAIAMAPLFSVRSRAIGVAAAGFMLVAATIAYVATVRRNLARHGGAPAAEAMAAAIRPHLHGGCLYIYDGDPILYYLTNSCLLSRYAFPSHLNLTREAGAIGVDPLAEIRRIMARRPPVVIDTIEARNIDESPVSTALFRSYVSRDYHPVAVIPLRSSRTLIYARLPGR